MIGTRAEMQSMFFDRAGVLGAIDERTRAMLMRFGSYTMHTARQSIRTRNKASRPGQPPSNHTGILRSNILFAYDPGAKSVVIGPAKLTGVTASTPLNGETVPSVLEKGGKVRTPLHVKPVKHKVGDFGYIRFGGKVNKTRSVRKLSAKYGMGTGIVVARVKLTTQKMVNRADMIEEQLAQMNVYAYGNAKSKDIGVQPRPFMVPAFNKELGVLDTLWQSAK